MDLIRCCFGLLLGLLISAVSFAQDVSIAGRTEASAGQLVVLSATTPTDQYQWVFDAQAFGDVMTCGESKTLAFVPAKPGRYVVWVVALSGDVLVKKVHAITVSEAVPNGGVSEQVPVITGLDSAVQLLSDGYAAKAIAMNDNSTAMALVAKWKAVSGAVRGSPNLETAGALLGEAFESAMSERAGLSRYVDWLGVFRRPLNEDLDLLVREGLVTTPSQLDQVIQAIAAAIEKRVSP